jgi:hypothetical protein
MARMNGNSFPPPVVAAQPSAANTTSTPGSPVHYLRRVRPAPVPLPALHLVAATADSADAAAERAAERAANRAIDHLVARAQHINVLAEQAEQDDHDACLQRTRELYARAAEDAALEDALAAAQAIASRCPPCNGDCTQDRECPVTWAARRTAWLAAAEPIERRRPWLWLVYIAAALGTIALSMLWPMGWAT